MSVADKSILRLIALLLVSLPCWSADVPPGCIQQDSSTLLCTKTNPPVISGGGKWFSSPYNFDSGAPPSGYTLKYAAFSLIHAPETI